MLKKILESIAPETDQVVVGVKATGFNPTNTHMRGGDFALVLEVPDLPDGDADGAVSAEVLGTYQMHRWRPRIYRYICDGLL